MKFFMLQHGSQESFQSKWTAMGTFNGVTLHSFDNYQYICFVVHQAFTRYPHYFGSNAAAQGHLTARPHPGSLCPEHCKIICQNRCQSAAGRGGDMCGF